MGDGDFEPEGWSAFDDHGAQDEKGNAGCAVFFIVIVVMATVEGHREVLLERAHERRRVPQPPEE